jgi:hypothetical protein
MMLEKKLKKGGARGEFWHFLALGTPSRQVTRDL